MIRKIALIVFVFLFTLIGAKSQNFAQRCEGKWEGTMFLCTKGELTDTVDVVFTVIPFDSATGSWSWKTVYLSETTPVTKNYTLIQKTETEFLLDEGDGVLLTNYVIGDKMYSLFKVEKNWLTASYELKDETLVFEVTSGIPADQKSRQVTNYTVDFVQRVVLVKSK